MDELAAAGSDEFDLRFGVAPEAGWAVMRAGTSATNARACDCATQFQFIHRQSSEAPQIVDEDQQHR